MSALNTTSEVFGTYEASFVKCDDPGSIILDIHYENRNMIAEFEYFRELNGKITRHSKLHENDPIDGRRYLLGEIVAVKLTNLWKAGIIVNFKIRDGAHYYELVLLDSGQLIEVHRMAFRHLNNDFQINHRYAFFGMMNLIPTGDDASSQSSWNVDACHDLRIMLDTASSITVTVMARQKFFNSERLFGNILIHIGKHVIDVKEMLLKNNSAYYNKEAFQRIYQLTEKDFCDERNEEIPHRDQESSRPEYEQLEVQQITDDTLDDHLEKWWRRGGADPLSQEERHRACIKLMGEAKISFARNQSLLTTDSSTTQRLIYSDSTPVEKEGPILSNKMITFQGSNSQNAEDMGDEYKQSNEGKFLSSKDSFNSRKSVSFSDSVGVEKESPNSVTTSLRSTSQSVKDDECKQIKGRKFSASKDSITSRRSISVRANSREVEKVNPLLTEKIITFQRSTSQDAKDAMDDECKQTKGSKFLASKDSITSRRSVSVYSNSTEVEKENAILTDTVNTFQRSNSQSAKNFMGDGDKQTKGRKFLSSKVLAPRREPSKVTNWICSDSDSDWFEDSKDRKQSRKQDSDDVESDATSTSLRSVIIEHYDDDDDENIRGIFTKKKEDSSSDRGITIMSEEHEKKLLALFQ